MNYRLAGLGDGLEGPVSQILDHGSLVEAVRAAEALLERNGDCESVEIFRGRRFVREVERRIRHRLTQLH
jgi:hypothetical protein